MLLMYYPGRLLLITSLPLCSNEYMRKITVCDRGHIRSRVAVKQYATTGDDGTVYVRTRSCSIKVTAQSSGRKDVA
jgi:hypothetical protein